ncbi:MAG TPA: tyrosine-type recombinase/integrase, partial [Bryobacteraceae bacterium]|nr:tyrosine-type recombinase/integrase [Bryobacteraceae bacterium]
MSYEADELRRSWKKCSCPIYASGTLKGRFKRRNTERTSWEEARALAKVWEDAGSWNPSATVEEPLALAPVPEPAVQPATDGRVTVARAIEAFTADFEEHAATNTRKTYTLLLKKMKAFSDARGFVMLDQWGPIDVREFRSSWGVKPQTAAKDMSTVKAFFEFCLSNEWLTRNPARLVKNPRGRDAADRRNEQKLPFSDDELRKMYDACETKYGKQEVKWSRSIHYQHARGEYARYHYKWSGQDLADFISVSVYTGLRISDVTTFHIDRMLSTGEIQVRTTKAGTHVYTWVPEWLQERIRARASEFGPYIFGQHQTSDMNVVTDVWRRKMKRPWSLCGPWTAKPTAHRFRHTFARILLQPPGVGVRDVAELLGNTEQMVRKHYAAWIPERQDRLTAVLRAAFSEK